MVFVSVVQPKAAKANWYLVRVYSGSEESIVNQIKSLAKTRNLDKNFKDFFIPKVKLQTKKKDAKGEEKIKESFKKLFPGYLAVNMVLNENTWNLVRELPKVIDFIGTKKSPKVLSEEDIKSFFDSVSRMEKINEKVSIQIGKPVKIKSGSFSGFKATVLSIAEDKISAIVSVPVFNTQTEISISIDELEILDN